MSRFQGDSEPGSVLNGGGIRGRHSETGYNAYGLAGKCDV